MPKYLNCCNHDVTVYPAEAFVNLTQKGPTAWVADGIAEGAEPIVNYPMSGHSIRIADQSVANGTNEDGVPLFKTTYGDITGVPEDAEPGSVFITSLPVVSNCKLKGSPLPVCSPKQVVRLASDTNTVLGCTGLTFQ